MKDEECVPRPSLGITMTVIRSWSIAQAGNHNTGILQIATITFIAVNCL